MKGPNLAGAVSLWAHRTPAIRAAILIGSQARPADDPVVRPDPTSDWDFQFVARNPAFFRCPRWAEALGCGPVRDYVVRKALWQGGLKVSVSFPEAQADLMVLPAGALRRLAWLSAAGCHRREGWTRRSLQGLIHYSRPSWKFLKEAGWVTRLYRRAAELPDPRLSDAGVRQLAAEFRCEHRWILRKLDRGELRAAQRGLHLELAEANFRLHHELRLRRTAASFEKGRRLEQICTDGELAAVTVSAACEESSLRAAVARAAAACQQFSRALLTPDPPPFCAIPAQEETATSHAK